MKKSYLIQLMLTVLIGPLGVLYSSTPTALIMIIVSILLSFGGAGGIFFAWLISIFVGMGCVTSHNDKINMEEKKHKELIAAIASGKLNIN